MRHAVLLELGRLQLEVTLTQLNALFIHELSARLLAPGCLKVPELGALLVAFGFFYLFEVDLLHLDVGLGALHALG